MSFMPEEILEEFVEASQKPYARGLKPVLLWNKSHKPSQVKHTRVRWRIQQFACRECGGLLEYREGNRFLVHLGRGGCHHRPRLQEYT